MNIGDYITSGILQDYCLGLLTNEEEKKVEIMCIEFPEVSKELQVLRLAIEKYANTDATWQREALRLKVWKEVKKLWEEQS